MGNTPRIVRTATSVRFGGVEMPVTSLTIRTRERELRESRCIVCGHEWATDIEAAAWVDAETGETAEGERAAARYVYRDGVTASACLGHDADLIRTAFVLAERTLIEAEP